MTEYIESGKRECVIISCVTFEVSKIVDPIKYYNGTDVYLIHYVRDGDPDNSIYNEFYNEVSEQLSSIPNIKINEICEPVYDYTRMLKTVFNLLVEIPEKYDNHCDVYVNLSSGTSEYVSAATVASMMVPGTIPFSVSTKEYTTPAEELRKVYFENNRPVGLTKMVNNPKLMRMYTIEPPEEMKIRVLRHMNSLIQRRIPVTVKNIIIEARAHGDWDYMPLKEKSKTVTSQKETMHFKRAYTEYWLKRNWIEKSPDSIRYTLTEEGRSAIEIFYTEPRKSKPAIDSSFDE